MARFCISGAGVTTLRPSACGISCGSDCATIFPLHDRDLQDKKQKFLSKGLEESTAVGKVEERETCYKIVHGNFHHVAIVSLMNRSLYLKDFKSTATDVNSGFPIERYWQLAKSQSMRHSLALYVDFSFGDILFNFSKRFDTLNSKERRVKAAVLADASIVLKSIAERQ